MTFEHTRSNVMFSFSLFCVQQIHFQSISQIYNHVLRELLGFTTHGCGALLLAASQLQCAGLQAQEANLTSVIHLTYLFISIFLSLAKHKILYMWEKYFFSTKLRNSTVQFIFIKSQQNSCLQIKGIMKELTIKRKETNQTAQQISINSLLHLRANYPFEHFTLLTAISAKHTSLS